jgi:hypothetical protein
MMDYHDIVQKSINAFMKGKTPKELAALKETGLIYTKEYFDTLEKALQEEPEKKKAGSKDE